MRRLIQFAFSSSVLLGSIAAHADDAAAPTTPEPTPVAKVDDQNSDTLNLPKGKVVINAFLSIDLSKGLVGKPISLSPDVWYGVTDDLTIGLVHSTVGTTGLLYNFGNSLCLSGKSDGCANVYQNVGADVRYRLMAPLSLDAGLLVRDTNPFEVAIKIGASGRWHFGKAAVELQPNVAIGLNKRSATMTSAGNSDILTVPVTGSYEVADKLELALQLGLSLPFEHTGDTYAFEAALGARYQVNHHLGLGLTFALPALASGSSGLKAFDFRTIMLGGSYAL
jgi:hypothetical protein